MTVKAEAGQRGRGVRGDCWVELQVLDSGGLEIELKSKVAVMYGKAITAQCEEVLEHHGVGDAKIQIEDSGALPYVITARLEAALQRAGFSQCLEPFGDGREQQFRPSSPQRFRRSRLYLPGNTPKFFVNAGLHQPDGVILDLEDSVAPSEKDAARLLVRAALRELSFYGAEKMVRINQLPEGLEDLKYVVPYGVELILIPKCETKEQVRMVVQAIESIQKTCGLEGQILLMPIIESAMGGLNALSIAQADSSVVALAIGLEDYTADIGVQRTDQGKESFWLRSQVVNAARAAGIQPIDTVFSDVADMDGLRQSVVEAKSLGFDGKGCIHPRQIAVIHEAFAPEKEEVAKATRIVRAFELATAAGLGVVSLGSKMIDPPVVKRAQDMVDLAIAAGVLAADWREGEGV